jgi:cellulose synthase/poly-beta-1,6-N-acetylglucosamine synthase-like glycosyltransferase
MELPGIFIKVLFGVLAAYVFMISAFTAGLVKILRRKRPRDSRFRVFVSVIIPVRNEAGNIGRILEEIRNQDYPADFMEVIIADDHSGDETMALAARFRNEHAGFPMILLPAPETPDNGGGKKQAIERAVAAASGEVLLFTDADTFRSTGWIAAMTTPFSSPIIQMVLGPVYFCREKNLLQKIESLEFLGLMGTTAGSAALGFPVMCNGASLAYRREAFFRIGGFRGHRQYRSGDDQFTMSAIRKHYGYGSVDFCSDPASHVGTVPEATLTGFLHQRLRWISKSRGYRDPAVITVGMVTFLAHLLLAGGMVAGVFNSDLFVSVFFLWGVKILVDLPLVWQMMRYFGKGNLAGYYLIAQVFQLVYLPLAGLLGSFLPYRWKGRRG